MNDALAQQIWRREGARGKCLFGMLSPFSLLYATGVQLRNLLFQWGWFRSRRLPRPVVSIGNLTVGGTGKTPTCLWLAHELQARGLRVGILSRGYRRRGRGTLILRPGADDCAIVTEQEILNSGDEPAMMARLYGQTIAVGANRSEAASELLRAAEIDVFVLDDGFQHRQLKRDVDLVLLGGDTSGWVLPSGPFREPRRNLRRADFLLLTGAQAVWKERIPESLAQNSYSASLRPLVLVGFHSDRVKEYPLSWLYRSKILTVTGIANPSGLYRLIHEYDGEIVNTLEFPDHHIYTTADWQQINRTARLVDLIVTTEKDILKLRRFPFSKDKLLALRVTMAVENGAALVDAIVKRIDASGRV